MSVYDEILAAKVRTAIANDMRLCDLPIDIRVSGGDVFVKGMVNSHEQGEVIPFILSGIAGVRHVDCTELEVKEGS